MFPDLISISAALLDPWPLSVGFLFYVDPGSMMPLASGIAAVIGVLLIFWQRVMRIVRGLLGKNRPTPDADSGDAYSTSVDPDDGVRNP